MGEVTIRDAEVVEGGYVYDERGLPVFTETDYESAVSEVARLRARDMETRLHLAAVLAAVSENRVYGEANLKEFAADVGIEIDVAWKAVQAYRRITDLDQDSGEQVVDAIKSAAISVTHVNIAASIGNNQTFMDLMEEAQRDRMTTARFGARVREVRHFRTGDGERADLRIKREWTSTIRRALELATEFREAGGFEATTRHWSEKDRRAVAREMREAGEALIAFAEEYAAVETRAEWLPCVHCHGGSTDNGLVCTHCDGRGTVRERVPVGVDTIELYRERLRGSRA